MLQSPSFILTPVTISARPARFSRRPRRSPGPARVLLSAVISTAAFRDISYNSVKTVAPEMDACKSHLLRESVSMDVKATSHTHALACLLRRAACKEHLCALPRGITITQPIAPHNDKVREIAEVQPGIPNPKPRNLPNGHQTSSW